MLHQIICGAVVGVDFAALDARAEVPPEAMPRLEAVQPSFQAMDERHQAAPTYPSLETAEDAAVLGQIWDRPALLGTPPYTAKSIVPAIEILKIQNMVLRSFRLHPEHDDPAQRSGALNEDISVRAHVMIVHTTAAVAQAAQAFVESTQEDALTEKQRAGVRTMRAGFTSLHAQLISALQHYRYKPQNIDLLTAALAETAPQTFSSIPLAQRPELEQALVASKSKAGAPASGRLDAMLAAIKSVACNRVCALK
jgi:hypothetical protein